MTLGILLQASSSTGAISQVVMIALIFVIFYFFMIRPQQRKQKDIKTYLESIKKGDQIVTIGGLHGKIVELDELTMIIDAGKGTTLKFDRSAISMESTKKAYGTAEKSDKK